jgi:hypothetical protein
MGKSGRIHGQRDRSAGRNRSMRYLCASEYHDEMLEATSCSRSRRSDTAIQLVVLYANDRATG